MRAQRALLRGWIAVGTLVLTLLTTLGTHPVFAWQGADRIAVTINEETVLADEFYRRLQFMRAQNFVQSVNPLRFRAETAGQLLLDLIIQERLLLQWAEKTKQMPSPQEVKQELDQLRQRPDIKALLGTGLLSEEMLERETRAQLARFNIATTAATVSARDVERWYEKNKDKFGTPERIQLAGILTTDPKVVPKIQADLKAGKKFEDLVQTYSQEPNSKARQGVLGTFNANDASLPAAFREIVKALKVGQVSGPIRVETPSTPERPSVVLTWFLRLVAREPEKVRPLEEVKTQVERLALLEQAGGIEVADKKMAEFRKQSKIKILLPGYIDATALPKKEDMTETAKDEAKPESR